MNIKICDRCGAEIKKEVFSKRSYFESIIKEIGEALNVKHVYILTNKKTGTPADLCPRCRTSLEHWMRHGEAIKKTRDRLKEEEHPEEKLEEPHAVEEVHVTDEGPCEKEKWHIPKFGEF